MEESLEVGIAIPAELRLAEMKRARLDAKLGEERMSIGWRKRRKEA